MSVEITPDQLDGDPKLVGHTAKGIKVYHLVTKGGYNVIAKHAGKGVDILGVGSHVAYAKHLAAMKNTDIQWELSKSEEYTLTDSMKAELPYWSAQTALWQSLTKKIS
jgi:hypothetical protein